MATPTEKFRVSKFNEIVYFWMFESQTKVEEYYRTVDLEYSKIVSFV